MTTPEVEVYLKNANHYYENSQMMLEKAEQSKAGELLWGAIAEGIKAFHLKFTGEPINNHNKIRIVLSEISLDFKDKGFDKDWVQSANHLHVNFYETFMDNEEFLTNYEKGKLVLSFIMNLIYKP